MPTGTGLVGRSQGISPWMGTVAAPTPAPADPAFMNDLLAWGAPQTTSGLAYLQEALASVERMLAAAPGDPYLREVADSYRQQIAAIQSGAAQPPDTSYTSYLPGAAGAAPTQPVSAQAPSVTYQQPTLGQLTGTAPYGAQQAVGGTGLQAPATYPYSPQDRLPTPGRPSAFQGNAGPAVSPGIDGRGLVAPTSPLAPLPGLPTPPQVPIPPPEQLAPALPPGTTYPGIPGGTGIGRDIPPGTYVPPSNPPPPIPEQIYGSPEVQSEAGTIRYKPMAPEAYKSAATALQNWVGQIPTGHVSDENWAEKARRWAEFYKVGAQGAYGQIPGIEAIDPMVRLQQQLVSAYDPTEIQRALWGGPTPGPALSYPTPKLGETGIPGQWPKEGQIEALQRQMAEMSSLPWAGDPNSDIMRGLQAQIAALQAERQAWLTSYRSGQITSGSTDIPTQAALPSMGLQNANRSYLSDLLAQRNINAANQLLDRSAGQGAPGAYSGLLGQQQRIRSALAEKAQARYVPEAYNVQRQVEDQQSQLLDALQKAQTETTYVGATAGRSI